MNMLFIIDDLEFKYFEFNKLVTSFWLIKEFLQRKNKVFVALKRNLYIKDNKGAAIVYEAKFDGINLTKSDQAKRVLLDDFSVIFFRPDPPVDIDYINASYVLDRTKTLVLNSPSSIRNKNEKLYVCDFPSIVPKHIVTSDSILIKEFLQEQGEIVIKPLNRCFSSGVFYLCREDKNTNTIINTATMNGVTSVMVQKYLPQIKEGDKRLTFIGGEIFEECVVKAAPNGDFKFSVHNDNYLKKGNFSEKDKLIEKVVSEKLLSDGVYIAGLDVVDGIVIEINYTSPCFFIKEINSAFNIEFEKKIADKLEMVISAKSRLLKI